MLPAMRTDSELVERARRGCRDSFAELVGLYHGRIRSFLWRYVRNWDRVDDLAQEAFLAAYSKLDSFRNEVNFGAWLLGIARNVALEHLRKERRRLRRIATGFDERLVEIRIQLEDLEAAQPDQHAREMLALQKCLDRLSKTSASVVSDYYFSGRSVAEIARQVQRNEAAVRMSLVRIRRSLHQCVRDRLAVGEA